MEKGCDAVLVILLPERSLLLPLRTIRFMYLKILPKITILCYHESLRWTNNCQSTFESIAYIEYMTSDCAHFDVLHPPLLLLFHIFSISDDIMGQRCDNHICPAVSINSFVTHLKCNSYIEWVKYTHDERVFNFWFKFHFDFLGGHKIKILSGRYNYSDIIMKKTAS